MRRHGEPSTSRRDSYRGGVCLSRGVVGKFFEGRTLTRANCVTLSHENDTGGVLPMAEERCLLPDGPVVISR